MKKIMAGIALLLLAGCEVVKPAADNALETLTTPPQEFLEFAKQALQWLLNIAFNFLTDLGNPLFKFLGL